MSVEGIVAWRNKNDTARECCRVVAVGIVGGVEGGVEVGVAGYVEACVAGGVSGVVAWCIKNDTARGCCRGYCRGY